MNTSPTSAQFWDNRYATASPVSNGKPGTILVRFAQDLPPGRALELGCARGDDAVWLAKRGWQVKAVDIAHQALLYAADNARRNGVEEYIHFEQHDLSHTLPDGEYDLVTASFLESPVDFGRAQVLNQAAALVARGGLLLITSHGSAASWSDHRPSPFPTPDEALAELHLNTDDWTPVFVGNIERLATGPNGETGEILDTVLALKCC
jgi:SAM-dependent methyltransferase